MEQDLILRGLTENTRRAYLGAVKGLARYYHRAPDQLTDEDVRAYLLHLIRERKLAAASCRQMAHALRFFYRVTLQRSWDGMQIPVPKVERKRPAILSREEVARLFEVTPNRKHRALLMTTYAAGLRVSEVVRLRVGNLDSERMLIRVEGGKGRKDRDTILSPGLLAELRGYWQQYRPPLWLFPNRHDPQRPLDRGSAYKIFCDAKARAGITKAGGIHALRHAFATHLLEAGIDVLSIRELLGHENLKTTANYLHLAHGGMARTHSALDLLQPPPTS
jgi:site-specific recombinase XerD